MKGKLRTIRWVVGILFIFSGLIKANDPLGLSYKMQEFFEAWHMAYLNDFSLPLAFVMNVVEVLAGVAIIVGWRMKFFSWLLLILIIFFTFLTGYATLSGKFRSCGCFGDCLPLTPLQSFIKDLVLLILILVLFLRRNKIKQEFHKKTWSFIILFFTIVGVSLFQSYALAYLPALDCLPYKKGNNLIEQMQAPKGSVSDSTQLMFIYKKGGKDVQFDQDHFPDDFNDSTYTYVNRFEKILRQGNDTPPISDFSLKAADGADTTLAILQQPKYVLLFAQHFANWHKQDEVYNRVSALCKQKNIPLFIVTANPMAANKLVPGANVLQSDGTVIKTAARVNGTYFIMQNATVKEKQSYLCEEKILKFIKEMN